MTRKQLLERMYQELATIEALIREETRRLFGGNPRTLGYLEGRKDVLEELIKDLRCNTRSI